VFVKPSPPRYRPVLVKRPPVPNFHRRAIAVSTCLLLAAAAGAQPTPPAAAPARPAQGQTDPNEGRPIRELRLLHPVPGKPGRTEPIAAALTQLIRNQLRSAEGQPFQRQVVEDDITRLNRLGRFQAISSEVQRLQDGSVILTFIVTEQPLIQDVQVVGNRELSDQEILQSLSIIAQTPVDRLQIDRNARAIEDLYRAKGYNRARVEVVERELEDSGIVLYRVIEGDRVRVTVVRFEGNRTFTARELRAAVRTTEYVPIFESAPLDANVLIEDVAALASYYRDRGHLDARASYEIQPSPDSREAIVTFIVDEGPLYSLRSVQVLYDNPEARTEYKERILKDPQADVPYLTPDQMRQIGRHAFSDQQIAGLMTIKPGSVYSEDKLRKSIAAIRVAYAKLGYIQTSGRDPQPAQLDARPVRDAQAPQVDLILFIREGTPTLTGEVTVIGNDITKQSVILRQLQVYPGRPLDVEALAESTRRIEGTRLFQPGSVRIAIQDPLPQQPGQPAEPAAPPQPGVPSEPRALELRDILVEVQETNTGKFEIGAVLNTDAGVTGRIAVTQSNFDIADVPESWGELFSGRAFRGAGQTISLELLPGNEQQVYSLTLSDPSLLETNYSGSGQVRYSNRIFRTYDEERFGGRFDLGRRFGSVWNGTLGFRAESVTLNNIDPDQPIDVFDSEGPSILTSVAAKFARTTTDDRFRPSRGGRLEFGLEQAGALGGDWDYTKLRYEYTAFFNLYESFLGYKTILKVNNQIAYIIQDKDSVPVFERFYLGGQSFRGFAFRAISPVGIRQDTGLPGDDPVGGTFLFFLGAEVNQPIYKDMLSVVGFVDSGTVESGFGLDQYRVAIGFGLRLYVQQLSPVPLAFDFGFPVLSQDTDRERVFTFAVDIPF